jgi:hypothetical protein
VKDVPPGGKGFGAPVDVPGILCARRVFGVRANTAIGHLDPPALRVRCFRQYPVPGHGEGALPEPRMVRDHVLSVEGPDCPGEPSGTVPNHPGAGQTGSGPPNGKNY